MEQQLLQNIIDITPTTMDDLLAKIQVVLASNSIEDEAVLSNIIKSLFYGLWNFDKMINQHNLSTKISQLLLKIPKKNAVLFFKQFLGYLDQKWNYIDHHRINKFMQLVRYLLAAAFKLSQKLKNNKKKIDQILLEKVFNKNQRKICFMKNMGLPNILLTSIFQICQQVLPQGATLNELEMFQYLLLAHQNQSFRLYIGEHIYEGYKKKIFAKHNLQTELEKIEQEIVQFSNHFLELAKKQQKDSNRKTLYNLIGFAKSTQLSFGLYLNQKRQKSLAEQQKKKKKLSKFKKEEIKAEKMKRKQLKKGKKINKIMSVRKFQDKNRMKKGIQQL